MNETTAANDAPARSVVDALRKGGREVQAPAGAVVVRRGEPGRAFYLVLEGRLEVRRHGEGDRQLTFTRLGAGSTFGEMALLRSEPVSADVVATEPSLLLECPRAAFHEALGSCPELATLVMTRLADSLDATSAEAWSFYQRAEALKMLVHLEQPREPIVAESAPMSRAVTRLEALAGSDLPVLIRGEAGSGKTFIAVTLHGLSRPTEAPLIAVDCRRCSGDDAARLLFGTTRRGASLDQTSCFGAYHLAHNGSLVLQPVESLDPSSQELLAEVLESTAGDPGTGATRFVATMDAARGGNDSSGLSDRLASCLAGSTVDLPPMRQRKADILPLARLFLGARGEPSRAISTDAEHALLAYPYRHRNAAELREAVALAALFAADGEIRAEHVFAGPKDRGMPSEYDLAGVRAVRFLSRPAVLRWLRGSVLASFVTVIGLCLIVPGTLAGRVANGLIWGLWEPAIIVLFLILGHVWCTVCPLSTAGLVAQRFACRGAPPPPWLKRSGVALATVGFFLIVWSERVLHMTRRPVASALLLLCLIAAAVAFAVLFQREVWCRYVCPLGTLAASFSLPAILHVRARPAVCTTQCTTHECYKGSAAVPGCSVFHHPLFASEAHLCKLCLRCLSSCPHGSARLYLRPPLQALWVFGGLSQALSPFAVAIFLLSLVLLCFEAAMWVAYPLLVTAVALVATLGGVLLSLHLPRLLSDEDRGDPALASRVALSLLVLGWGPLMAYQLGNVPGLGGVRLHAAPGSAFSMVIGDAGFTLLAVLQLLVTLAAAGLAVVALAQSRKRAREEGCLLHPLGWRLITALVTLYLAVTTAVIVARGLS